METDEKIQPIQNRNRPKMETDKKIQPIQNRNRQENPTNPEYKQT